MLENGTRYPNVVNHDCPGCCEVMSSLLTSAKVKRKGSKALPPPEEGGTGQRQAALDAALMQIECSFGSGSVMRMGDMSAANKDIAVIPTGSLALDAALGVGGLPKVGNTTRTPPTDCQMLRGSQVAL